MFDMTPQGPEIVLYYTLLLWSYAWKGIALWRAARDNQRNWFIVMIVLPTAGILEIVYLFRFAKNKLTLSEIKSWSQKVKFKTKQAKK